MKILVTGHTGLIGSHLVDRLVDEHEVYGISWMKHSNHTNPKCKNIELDLSDYDKVRQTIKSISPDILYHLAANVSEVESVKYPAHSVKNNIGVFMNTISPAIDSGVKRIIFFSTNGVYGNIDCPYRETDTPQPHDIYAINKLMAEESLKLLCRIYGVEYVILRPHNVYGPRQYMKDRTRNVVALFMNKVLRGEPITLINEGKPRRNFTYVDDLVEIAVQSMTKNVSGLIINSGSNTSSTIKELAESIIEASGKEVELTNTNDRAKEVVDAIPDHTIQNRIFELKETPLKEGIKKMWSWCKQQGPQEMDEVRLEIERK